jgi:hypothetical protein
MQAARKFLNLEKKIPPLKAANNVTDPLYIVAPEK